MPPDNLPAVRADRRDLLNDRVVLVSGVGPGLGRSCALAALDAGAQVAMADLDGDRAQAIAKELDPAGERTLVFRTDITDSGDVADLARHLRARWDHVDGIVHVAALDTPTGGVLDGDLDDWD